MYESVTPPESKVELTHTQLITLFNFINKISPNGSMPCVSGSAALQLNQASNSETKYKISDLDFISVANPWQPQEIIKELEGYSSDGFNIIETAHVEGDDSHAHAAGQSFNSHYVPASHIVTLKVQLDDHPQPVPIELICSDDSAGYKYKDEIALGEGKYLDFGEFNVFDATNPKAFKKTQEVTHLSLPALTLYYLVAKPQKALEIIRRHIQDESIDTLMSDMFDIADPKLLPGLNELQNGILALKELPTKAVNTISMIAYSLPRPNLDNIVNHWFPLSDLHGYIFHYYSTLKKLPTPDGEAEFAPANMLPLTDPEVFKQYEEVSRILSKTNPNDQQAHYENIRKILTDSSLETKERKANLISEFRRLST